MNKTDIVTIQTWDHTIELAEEIAQTCFEKGADVMLNLYTDKYYSSYLNTLPVESLKEPSKFCTSLADVSTVEIFAGAIEDPRIFDRIPPEKRAADREGEQKAHGPRLKGRKPRTATLGLALVTPARADVYGIDYREWRKMMMQASNIDYDQLSKTGKMVADLLEKSSTVRIESPGGTNLSFELGGREPVVDDGIIDDQDITEGHLDVTIPAGSVSIAPLESSVTGTVHFDTPLFFRGKVLKGLNMKFGDGRLENLGAKFNEKVLMDAYNGALGDRDRLASLTIGLNSEAKSGYIVNSITAGSITIGIGANRQLGGVNSTNFYLGATLSNASAYLDDFQLVKEGKLQL